MKLKGIYLFFFLCVYVSLYGGRGYAQELKMPEKETLIVGSFRGEVQLGMDYGPRVRNQVLAALQKLDRVNVIDRESESVIKKMALGTNEEHFNKETIMADSEFDELRKNGANYLLLGDVSSVSVIPLPGISGLYGINLRFYTANVVFTLKLYNLKDASLLVSKTFNIGEGWGLKNASMSRENALSNVFDCISAEVIPFFNENFKIRTCLLEISKAKRGAAKEVFILGGELLGIQNGLLFNVTQKVMRGSFQTTELIGVLKVVKVERETSKCKVTEGGREIMEVFHTRPEDVFIVSDKIAVSM